MNQVLASGRLAADPRVKRNGESVVCVMRLAIARQRADRERGAVFIDLVAFGRLAAVCGEYLERGSRVAASARLELSEWTDADGRPRSRHELIAHEVEFLDRPNGWTPPERPSTGHGAPAPVAAVDAHPGPAGTEALAS